MQLVWSMLGSSSVLTGQVVSDIITSLVVRWKVEFGATSTQLLASLSHGMEFNLDKYTCQYCYVGQARDDSHSFVSVMIFYWILLKGRFR